MIEARTMRHGRGCCTRFRHAAPRYWQQMVMAPLPLVEPPGAPPIGLQGDNVVGSADWNSELGWHCPSGGTSWFAPLQFVVAKSLISPLQLPIGEPQVHDVQPRPSVMLVKMLVDCGNATGHATLPDL
jgi:hypothetical protein